MPDMHPAIDSIIAQDDKTLADGAGWKQCPGCRNLVERTDGCDHMMCECGTAFCYRCGGALHNGMPCECEGTPEWVEQMRQEQADAAARDDEDEDEDEEEEDDDDDDREDEEDDGRDDGGDGIGPPPQGTWDLGMDVNPLTEGPGWEVPSITDDMPVRTMPGGWDGAHAVDAEDTMGQQQQPEEEEEGW